MPSKSTKQQNFFRLVRAVQKGERSPSSVSPELRKVASTMSPKDAGDFASSLAEFKQKKIVLSILKDIVEPMYLNEQEMNPIAKAWEVKGKFDEFNKRYIGQSLSEKELEAVNTFTDVKPSKIERGPQHQIRYETTTTFNTTKTTVIKKLKEGSQQFVFFATTKYERIKTPGEEETPEGPSGGMGLTPMAPMSLPGATTPPTTPEPPPEEQKPEEETIIVSKSQPFKGDIEGGAILIEFLKKLDL